ncbi:zinc metalloproteinase-disintegrin-like batroxstatin-1 isoform X2 [Amphiura filiformis]|uniref:zinc metalloproteinase-disintegrin-like batroxstatin-1 isoform X2 n=1 Tax=Amphiura filiformis TaxID=82378 RepID=UPI003B21DDBA
MILWRYLCVISICSGSSFAAPTDFHGNENDDDDSRTDGGTRSDRSSTHKVPRSIPTEERRYIEIAIVIDNMLYSQLDDSIDVNVKTVMNNVNMLYSSKLNVNIQLVTVEKWNTEDQISISDSIKETLQSFQDFNTRILSSTYSPDSAYLLSGHSFTNSASSNGISSFRALCSRQGSAGVIQVQDGFNVSSVSTVLARLIGISLGMPIDSDSCNCPSGAVCVMNRLNKQIPSDFSLCSKDAFNLFVQSGRGWCLKDFSNLISSSPPICGNGILEENEQCDCGSKELCAQTSCCRNCTLISGAQCSGGPCCDDNCQFLGTRRMCRKADGECDIPEFCTGKSSQCPKNIILLDGQSCNNKKGVCVSNSCLLRSSQCTYLWGKGAEESDITCYPEVKNNSNSRFCQHIYCDVTSASEDQVVIENANISVIDDRPICRAASVVLPDGTDLGLVFEGSSCDTGSGTCSDRHCIESTLALPGTCPGISADGYCSSNGICNSQFSCVCSCGWTGISCNESKTNEGSTIDMLTGSACPPLSTTNKPKGRQTVTKIFEPDPPPPPAETSKDPATFMSSAIIGGSVAIIFVVAVVFGATSIGFRVKRSRMSIFQPTPKQKQKLNKMENDRIMKTKRLKDRLDAQKKARKTGIVKGPSGGACCTDGRLPKKDRTTERLLIDMETEYRPVSRASNETVM